MRALLQTDPTDVLYLRLFEPHGIPLLCVDPFADGFFDPPNIVVCMFQTHLLQFGSDPSLSQEGLFIPDEAIVTPPYNAWKESLPHICEWLERLFLQEVRNKFVLVEEKRVGAGNSLLRRNGDRALL